MRAFWLGLLLGTALRAQCPYVRYILFDACGSGTEEGCNEHLLLYTPVDLNIDNIAISFPIRPNNTNPDNDSPTEWVCNGGGCAASWVNNATVISTLNTNACTGTNYTYAVSGTTIPAGSWVLLFVGSCTTEIPNSSNLCGVGTVYVAFASNTQGSGRYGNTVPETSNRRTRIAFIGMPACSMTVNYRGLSSSVDGRYMLIDPTVCIGLTEGQHNTPPSTSACYYSSSGSNGVSMGVQAGCALPSVGVLPVIWAEVRVEGAHLLWRVEGQEVGQRLALERQEGGGSFSGWVQIASDLPWQGRYELPWSGLYRLVVEGVQGRLATSPVVEYHDQTLPRLYPNPAPGGPYLYQAGAVARLTVYNSQGQVLRGVAAPIEREVLRGLPPGMYWVELYTWDGLRLTQTLWVSP